MNSENDEKTLQDIRDCLDRLDREIRVETPGMDKIRMLVNQVEDRKKKKNDFQFLLFIIFAAFAVSLEALAFSQLSFTVFIVVQAVALVCYPIVLSIRHLKKQRQVEGL